MEAAQKAAREFITRENFIRTGPLSFHDDVCSEDIPYGNESAVVLAIIAERLERLEEHYCCAARTFAEMEVPDAAGGE
jgi:hypothetical protein